MILRAGKTEERVKPIYGLNSLSISFNQKWFFFSWQCWKATRDCWPLALDEKAAIKVNSCAALVWHFTPWKLLMCWRKVWLMTTNLPFVVRKSLVILQSSGLSNPLVWKDNYTFRKTFTERSPINNVLFTRSSFFKTFHIMCKNRILVWQRLRGNPISSLLSVIKGGQTKIGKTAINICESVLRLLVKERWTSDSEPWATALNRSSKWGLN